MYYMEEVRLVEFYLYINIKLCTRMCRGIKVGEDLLFSLNFVLSMLFLFKPVHALILQ